MRKYARKNFSFILVITLVLVLLVGMIPAQAKSNSDFVIFLQAGHSPSAKTSGASVTYDGKTIREDDLNEKLTYYTYQKLTAAGYTVYLTNPITLYPNLPSVIQTPCPSNRSQYDLDVILDAIHNPSKYNSKITSQPDLVLSLHHNSSGDGTVSASNPSGCITFYTNWVGNRDGVGKYERNQESVQRSYDFANILNSSFQQSSYPSKSSVQLNNSNNHLTKYSRVPTILLEAGFMTNTNDLTAVQKDSNMSIMADRITSAVNSYAAKYPNSIPPYSSEKDPPTATWFQPDETTNSKFIAQVGGVTDKSGVKSVLFEVWNCSAGYGSAKQYAGVNTASGVWDATVDISKFDNKYGMYGVNIYGTDNKGNTGCMMTKYVNVIYDSSLSYTIMGDSGTTVNQMINYYLNSGKTYPQYYIDRNVDLAQFCQIYYEEAKAEGVKVDVAFAQMIYETGWLQFGGIVPVEYFNFAGLGAFDNNSTGQCANFAEKFGDNATGIRMGIRAQIQHLKCYASSASLVNSCVDPRWDAVVNIYGRGSAPTLGQLSAKWATNTSYGYSIMKLINSLNSMSNTLSANTLSLFAPPEAAPSTSPEAAPSVSPEAE